MDVLDRLQSEALGERARRLGFADQDREDLLAHAPAVLADPDSCGRVVEMVTALNLLVGDFAEHQPFATPPAKLQTGSPQVTTPHPGEPQSAQPQGLEPMLALIAAVDEVRDFHRGRGIAEEDSWRALSDLGQQVAVHRMVFEEFGLHAQNWLATTWSGALFWLGRLQFNLVQPATLVPTRWVLSTHIPRRGSLAPGLVDESFRAAAEFFGEHFPDYQVAEFYCRSWLLDPGLAALGESNTARFAERWQLVGEPDDADADVEFFVFCTRARPPHDQLQATTSLERVISQRWASGGHWHLCEGVIGIDEAVPARTGVATDA